MISPRILITSFGYGIYSVEYVPAGMSGESPPIESVGLDPERSELVRDPGNPERLYVMAPTGFPPSGLENVTEDDRKRLQDAVETSGSKSFVSRLGLFKG